MTTFVLIHGSFQGGWIWKFIAAHPRDAGHTVYAPTLDGCDERAGQLRPGITSDTQAAEIAKFLWSEDLRDVVLVAASSGGMVVTKTAELARDRIARLMFVDALTLRHGECIRDIVSGSDHVETEFAAGPTRDDRFQRYSQDMDEPLAAWAADRSTLHPIGVTTKPVVLEKFWDQEWDASVVFCRQAKKPGEAHQRRTADALNARWIELDTGHYPMLSMPDALTQIILEG